MSDTASGLIVLPPTTAQPACMGRQQPASASLPTLTTALKTASSPASTKNNTTTKTTTKTTTTTKSTSSTSSTTARSNASSPRASPPPRRTQKFPTPLIFPPLGGKHKQTFIVLHNRGTNARRFGPRFVEQPVSPLCAASPSSSAASSCGSDKSTPPVSEPPSPSYNISNLQTLLPYTRFVFPSASMSRSSAHEGGSVSQWFDMDPSASVAENDRLMVEGLRETTAYLHGLIECEAKLVGGAKNVILGGLSQGSAASLVATLLWTGEPLRACIGMAGWLPLRERLQRITMAKRNSRDREEPAIRRPSADEQPSETADDDEKSASHVVEENADLNQAVRLLQRHLGFSTTDEPATFAGTPIFIGHGADDDFVSVEATCQAAGCLSALGFDVQHEEYDGLGNWYSEQMLGDAVGFLGCIDRPIMLQATPCHAHDDDHAEASANFSGPGAA